jgi:hypothetical protein
LQLRPHKTPAHNQSDPSTAKVLIQSGIEGELNEQFNWNRPVVKERTRAVDQGTSRNWCCSCGFWPCIWKGNRHQKAVCISSGADRHCPKRAMGEGSGDGEGYSYPCQTHALSSSPQEDRRCAKGPMGTGESRKENGLAAQDFVLSTRSSLFDFLPHYAISAQVLDLPHHSAVALPHDLTSWPERGLCGPLYCCIQKPESFG